ncbi:hypothetical protein SAMN05216582_105108 [Selenomonas ruminantium]|uniref:Tetratricopeptide repeat-containing protein n=1 Tax=Selenomonas ruminantium TaxID=971 RepID=A0A1M6SW35_SELRU|nr:hypothetical protein [Selenomonas ruminantium]SHK48931.1 hypothetical protein SAMN05216582_105108 [Selenomonas ruminantium]
MQFIPNNSARFMIGAGLAAMVGVTNPLACHAETPANISLLAAAQQEQGGAQLTNVNAFQDTMLKYRDRQELQNAINYGQSLLQTNPAPELALEICAQLGSIYTYDLPDRSKALPYVNRAIELARQKHSQTEIERLVNDGGLTVEFCAYKGETNTIREIYIMKAVLENTPPAFESHTVIKDVSYVETDNIQNIIYPTNWTGSERVRNDVAARKITPAERTQLDEKFNQETSSAIIDLERHVMIFNGIGLAPSTAATVTKAKIAAKQVAWLDALRSLTERIMGIDTTYPDENTLIAQSKTPPNILNHAYEIGTFPLDDAPSGFCTYMEIPLQYIEGYLKK